MSMYPPPPPHSQPPNSATSPYQPQFGSVQEHPNGTTVLVLGILGLVACGLIAPFAWSMGNKALREMGAQPQVTWTNRGNVTAGRICGIIGTCLIALVAAVAVLVVVVAAVGSTGSF